MLPHIAIPSYRRATTIRQHTLRFLDKSTYPRDRITIFVASEAERLEYLKSCPDFHLVVGVPGLAAQRNFIRDFYSDGQILIQMDDDVRDIKSNLSFLELVEKGVSEIDEKCGLWGILPNDDGRRFKDDTTYHLTHIIGSFFICRNDRAITINTEEKEDMERSVLYFKKYGMIARYRGAGVTTTYDRGTGGLICNNRKDKMLAGIQYMLANYPNYAFSVQKTKGLDIMLNWRASAHANAEDNSDSTRD